MHNILGNLYKFPSLQCMHDFPVGYVEHLREHWANNFTTRDNVTMLQHALVSRRYIFLSFILMLAWFRSQAYFLLWLMFQLCYIGVIHLYLSNQEEQKYFMPVLNVSLNICILTRLEWLLKMSQRVCGSSSALFSIGEHEPPRRIHHHRHHRVRGRGYGGS
jgi:hypothetical protein